jgi:hypothetical protein
LTELEVPGAGLAEVFAELTLKARAGAVYAAASLADASSRQCRREAGDGAAVRAIVSPVLMALGTLLGQVDGCGPAQPSLSAIRVARLRRRRCVLAAASMAARFPCSSI